MKKRAPIHIDDIMIRTMEDTASVNVGKVRVCQNHNVTKTNMVAGQVTGDNTKSYVISSHSDIYDMDQSDQVIRCLKNKKYRLI
ncbi:spore germination protein [Radiobacillus deserti]|uniref:Uncharacterized protein n=1 Tax=Radiobacillus deserti TaxID=2594883 RepID=A0A516KFV7_9BACI|nr:spore germination protein [Radiobacillus deserti]QDP40277.1 hypothetical protein FN924_08880 [Radiobacillus deserti]